MDIAGILASLEASGLSTRLKDSLWLFPLVESTHVVGLTLVFGTIMIVDLRLLGLASTRRPFTRLTSDLLKWTWAAFALTAVTGLLMFITNAAVYYNNFYFRAKMLTLVLAGINMMVFEFTTGKAVRHWDTDTTTPRAAKAAGALSLLLWTCVIVTGRWIGFTTAQTGGAPVEGIEEINMDDLFSDDLFSTEPDGAAVPEEAPADAPPDAPVDAPADAPK